MEQSSARKAVLSEILDRVDAWLEDSLSGAEPVIDFHRPEVLKAKLNLSLDGEGGGTDALVAETEQYLRYAVRTPHPAYVNQLFGGFNLAAFAGEIVTAATNTSMYTYEVAPVATLMEMAVVDKMRTYTGWPTGTGSMMTGGSNTNLVAMLLARNSIFKGAKEEGISGLPKLAVFVSERAHFSMLKAANTTGIGAAGVIKVPVDENGRMRGAGLEEALKETIARGRMPFMVCSTAGTTETGSFDAIDEVSNFAERHKLWHHVDGSWGASMILSARHRSLFKGLDRADSFSWNPHKLMNIPLICSVLLVKDPNVMRSEIQSHDADYIYHENDTSDYDMGPASLQCGRRVDVLKLWMAWKYYGDDGYAARIDRLTELADYATRRVETDERFQLTFPTQTLNVNFRSVAPEGADSDRFNENLRYRLIREGSAMVNYCRLDTGLSIRLILLNPDLTEADLDRFFDAVANAAEAERAALKSTAES